MGLGFDIGRELGEAARKLIRDTVGPTAPPAKQPFGQAVQGQKLPYGEVSGDVGTALRGLPETFDLKKSKSLVLLAEHCLHQLGHLKRKPGENPDDETFAAVQKFREGKDRISPLKSLEEFKREDLGGMLADIQAGANKGVKQHSNLYGQVTPLLQKGRDELPRTGLFGLPLPTTGPSTAPTTFGGGG